MSFALLRLYHSLMSNLFESSKADRARAYEEVRESHQMRPSYLIMLVLACLVALFGLLSNSPAVVIGAMLISPLMNPFLSAGLALAIGDWPLGRAALRTIGLSVFAAVAISALAVAISPLKEVTSEITARTNPNLLDLGIAFFSGFAGTFTLISRKGGTTIPGVAIATAVMPPLCVVGFGAYHMDPRIFFGALSLFMTNLAAIIISAATVFLLAAFRASDRPIEPGDRFEAPRRIIISFAVLLVLSIPLALALVRAADDVRLRKTVGQVLLAQVQSDPARARLASGWGVRPAGTGGITVDATVRTVEYFSREEVDKIRGAIEQAVLVPVDLQFEQIEVRQGGLDVKPSLIEQAPPPPPPTLEDRVREVRPAAELATTILGAKMQRYSIEADEQGIQKIRVYVFTIEPPDADVVAAAERGALDWLKQRGTKTARSVKVDIFARPTEPVVFPIEQFRRGMRIVPDAQPELARIGRFATINPSIRLRLFIAPEQQEFADDLRDQLARAIAISTARIEMAKPGEEAGKTESGIDIQLVVPPPPQPNPQ